MTSQDRIDVNQLVGSQPMGRFQWLVTVLCFCIVALDGFDASIMGVIAPELTRVWGISTGNLGPVISAALIGLAVGALVAGPLADRFGRKIVIVTSVLFFGLWTLAAAMAPDITWLIVFRFLTGLGLGASMPNTATIISEYAPEKHRSILVTVVFCGFTFGAAAGGFIAADLIPAFGWQSVLLVGGILPVLLVPVLMLWLPESVRLLVVKGASPARIRRIVERMVPGATHQQTQFAMPAAAQVKTGGIAIVLSKQYLFGSVMLWATYFMGLFLVYLLGSWLPTLVKGVGFSVRDAALITAFFQLGGTAGSLFLGWSMDRREPHRVLTMAFLVGGVFTFLLGMLTTGFILFVVAAFAVGFCFNGGNTGMTALATLFYPTEARSTGASWMHGIGRFGAIASAFAGAQMLGAGWSFSQVFTILAIPAFLAALAVFLKGSRYRKRKSPGPLVTEAN
jgi:AAHS family 4-hydroxybenzoate transporter-like MFS transporter